MSLAHSPRIVTDGLVLAFDAANSKSYNSAENLMTSSETFTAWSAVNVTYESDVIIAPDGTLTADAVIATAANVGHYFSRGTSGTTLDNTVYTFSIYVKHKGFDILHFQPVFKDGTYDRIAFWNLSTKTATTTGSGISSTITELPNGWFRITSTFNSKTGASPIVPLIYIGAYGPALGDGVNGVYAWGVQVNRGSAALPYVKTTTTAIAQSTTINDLSGLGNNGVFFGQTYYEPSLVNLDSAFMFDGADDYIEVPDSDSVSLTGNMSICAWVKVTNFSTFRGIVSKANPTVPAPFDYYLTSGGVPRLYRGNGSSYDTISATLAPLVNAWQHLSVTVEGLTVTHYLNGNLNGSGNLIGTLSVGDGNGTIRIGNRADLVTDYLGKLSNIILYSRALSADEVKQNFNALRGRYGL